MVPVLRGPRQDDHIFEASLAYIVKPCLICTHFFHMFFVWNNYTADTTPQDTGFCVRLQSPPPPPSYKAAMGTFTDIACAHLYV